MTSSTGRNQANVDQLYGYYIAWLAYYIATFEGYFKPGSIAARQNNPGNLRSWGSRPRQGGFAVFPTANDGWLALMRQVDLNIKRELTPLQFFAGKPGVYPGYAPATDNNNPFNYAVFLSDSMGIPVNQSLIRSFYEKINTL